MTATIEAQINVHLRALGRLYRRLDNRRPPEVQLLDRELRAAMLAAVGLSNREIAARLYLSEDGVKNHLRVAFVKLGIRRRSQLAWVLAGRLG